MIVETDRIVSMRLLLCWESIQDSTSDLFLIWIQLNAIQQFLKSCLLLLMRMNPINFKTMKYLFFFIDDQLVDQRLYWLYQWHNSILYTNIHESVYYEYEECDE